jgi:predicted dehydrogenase
MKKIRLGVFGFGSGRGAGMVDVGKVVTGGLIDVGAVYEPSDEKFEWACKSFDLLPKRCASPEELAVEPLDGFIIASPNHCHYDNLKYLKDLKVPILLEKPLDADWNKILDIVRFEQDYQGKIVVGHCLRYAPIVKKAAELIKGGAIGRVCSARFTQNCYYGNGMFHNWRARIDKGGGMLVEKGTHDLDLMASLVGAKPVSVFASLKQQVFGGDKPENLRCGDCDEKLTCQESELNFRFNRSEGYPHNLERVNLPCPFSKDVDCYDDEMLILQFDSGIHASYIETFYTPKPFDERVWEVVGDLGIIRVTPGLEDDRGKLEVFPRFAHGDEKVRYDFDYCGRGHYGGDVGLMRHFYDLVTGDAVPESTVKQAFMAEIVGYAALESSRDQKVLRIEELVPEDLKDYVFSD